MESIKCLRRCRATDFHLVQVHRRVPYEEALAYPQASSTTNIVNEAHQEASSAYGDTRPHASTSFNSPGRYVSFHPVPNPMHLHPTVLPAKSTTNDGVAYVARPDASISSALHACQILNVQREQLGRLRRCGETSMRGTCDQLVSKDLARKIRRRLSQTPDSTSISIRSQSLQYRSASSNQLQRHQPRLPSKVSIPSSFFPNLVTKAISSLSSQQPWPPHPPTQQRRATSTATPSRLLMHLVPALLSPTVCTFWSLSFPIRTKCLGLGPHCGSNDSQRAP